MKPCIWFRNGWWLCGLRQADIFCMGETPKAAHKSWASNWCKPGGKLCTNKQPIELK